MTRPASYLRALTLAGTLFKANANRLNNGLHRLEALRRHRSRRGISWMPGAAERDGRFVCFDTTSDREKPVELRGCANCDARRFFGPKPQG